MNRLVAFLAALTLTGGGLVVSAELITDVEQVTGDYSLAALVSAAQSTALITDTKMLDAMRDVSAVNPQVTIDGNVVRWQGPEQCRQITVIDVWTVTAPEACVKS